MDEFVSCDQVWDLLSIYADGEASPSERDTVESHVLHCQACSLDLQFMRETASVLAHTPLVSPPPDLKQAILAATIYRPTWQERLLHAFAGLQPVRLRAAGGAFAILLIGILAYKNMRGSLPVVDMPGPAIRSTNSAIATTRKLQPERLATPAAGDRVFANATEQPSGKGEAEDVRAEAKTVPPEPIKVASLKSVPHLSPAVLTTRPTPRKQSIRVPDDSRLASIPAPRPADENSLDEPADMREGAGSPGSAGSEIAKNEPGTARRADTDASEPVASPHTRYTLTASLPPSGADAMVSLAELRSALRKRGEPARTVALDLHSNDRNALWDVYKSRF